MELLTRDKFREAVFERDGYKCVICGEPAKDAHHIIERRLFHDGGYYLDNGASVCEIHHLEAEMTTLHPDDLREAAGITETVLTDHLYFDQDYDKWGNPIMNNGTRIKGELFHDESVQKILSKGNVLDLFVDKVKYPRTYHLPWSQAISNDDRIHPEMSIFEGQEIMICEKLDGENTTWYNHGLHARSLNSGSHPSRNRVKDLWAQKSYNIPDGWRVCGENMYAKHSIYYCNEPTTLIEEENGKMVEKFYPGGNALDHYFYMFSIWDEKNNCLSWEETVQWAELLELPLVPVWYVGPYDEEMIRNLKFDERNCEGYVIRLTREYNYAEFKRACGKYVRKGHVGNHGGHWMSKKIIPNELKSKNK